MATNLDDWTKEPETDLAPLAADMWGRKSVSKKKASGWIAANKMPSGCWLTANNHNRSPDSIKVQSDGSKTVVTIEGTYWR
jgi:hypothetical protein